MINALQPELSSLASNAAVELDLLINGEATDLAAVKQLGACLQQTLDKEAPDQPARGLHVDTETETVLGQAFTQTGADPTTIISDLSRRMEKVADELAGAQSGKPRTELETQRAFCLALSQSAAGFRQMIAELRPPHPFRR